MRVRFWLARAMTQDGEPSSKRLVFVVGLLVVAPVLLIVCLLKSPEQFATSFAAWCVACGGAYAVSRFAESSENAAAAPATSPEGSEKADG